ncbi:CHAD domain-containing protein [Fodinicola acaciae]|uniref:CHAD domain-containing protein n=1 Tax=Fodinicola acaciae TaxID=2681555 RepID=UPI0013D2BB53|nr:hypothetical protein [Fodinicola acaciae]
MRRGATALHADHQVALDQLTSTLDSDRYFRLLDELDALLTGPMAKAARRPAKTVAGVAVGDAVDHQDAVVARSVLLELAGAAYEAGEDAFTYGVLYQREADHARTLQRQLTGRWRQTAASLRRWIGPQRDTRHG